jgi:signal transduction histidine kinase
MTKIPGTPIREKPLSWSIDQISLVTFSIVFAGVISGGWIYAMNLRQTVAASNAVANVDVRALIEIERIRNIAELQIGNSRAFFLLGSKSLFDEQKKEKQALKEALVNFQKQFSLPHVPELVKRIEALELQQEELFDQAMKYREKQTESKIVGQFYQSKTSPIVADINHGLDEIVKLHNAEHDRVRAQAREAATAAEVQIPRGMTWFTGLVGILFLCMVLLSLRMFHERKRQLAVRERLYSEAQTAIKARDEIISAVSFDFREPLATINDLSKSIMGSPEAVSLIDKAEMITATVGEIDGLIKDILDQSKADMGTMTLRLDQLGIEGILDEARLMMQSMAKHRDIRLQFEKVNPPVLAFLDRERVMRVLGNLVGNAIKFSPRHSKVVVKVRSDQQFVFVSVADSGPGIPDSQMSGVFDNFWQARRTADQGAGVGLAVVKTIVEAHGGSVRAESHPGIGSTFTFSLPRRRPAGAHVGRLTPIVRPVPQIEV